MSSIPHPILELPAFVELPRIDWERVKRTRYYCFQRFHYSYPGPVRNLRQKLLVAPPDSYGDQQLCDYQIDVWPHPVSYREVKDSFGNRVARLDVGWIGQQIAFEAQILVERSASSAEHIHVSSEQQKLFLEPTALTVADRRVEDAARALSAGASGGEELAERICEWVARAFRYGSGATGVHTPAAQALAGGTGLCQDYAHVMLAICRAAGLPARYVSGHMLAEGGSHAWVDVLLPCPCGEGWRAIGFDPTNCRRPNLGYTVVAVGRDYMDVPPTSGTYTGPYSGRLQFSKRAGLTLIEFTDGEIIQTEAPAATA